MRLSVCLIAKNEAENIPACFDSIKSIADEIILVDTGSTDDTVKIAESFGVVKVFHEKWINDFSVARNASISKATCEWTMWMDCDDRLTLKAQDQISQIKNDPLRHAFAFHIKNVNPLPITTALTTLFMHIRMWPTSAGVRFTGRLHESALNSAIEKGLILTDTNIIVEHHGYQNTTIVHDKMIRNIKLKLIEMGFPVGSDFLFLEIGDLMCFYVPHALTIWKDMGMIWLAEPFERGLIATNEEKLRLIEEYVKKNTFV